MKYLILLLLVSGCVDGNWSKPSQDSAPEGYVNLVEINL